MFMSATIDFDSFCRTLAIPKDKAEFIRVNDSPFDASCRRVYCMNVARLSKDTMQASMPAMGRAVESVLNKHGNDKGLVLTTSYAQIDEIKKHLSARNSSRLIVTGNGVSRTEILKKHISSPEPTVLISPSFYTGVDLKDDLSRFQIIVKAPYLDLGDGRIAAKMKRDDQWYLVQSVMKLVQGCGRSVRNDRDSAVTYILDSNATAMLRRADKIVPQWFKDAVVYTTMP